MTSRLTLTHLKTLDAGGRTRLLEQLRDDHLALKALGLSLDLTRGKPAADQLDISDAMDGLLQAGTKSVDGTDARNYGTLEGLVEARELGAELLPAEPADVIAWNNASLTLMYYLVHFAHHLGLAGHPPWQSQAGDGAIKFLCPVPGYDRHFTLTAALGIEMINLPMLADGPDMDLAEQLVRDDPLIKGMWNVPKHSNPTGVTYSDAVVERIAALPRIAGEGFLVLMDNAYGVHELQFPGQQLASPLAAARRAGSEDQMAVFASTSKITYAGAGVSFFAAGAKLKKAMLSGLSVLAVGPDKVNQLRHVRFLQGRLEDHMRAQAELTRPKFDLVERHLSQGLTGLADWSTPTGGYFVSVNLAPGTARRCVELAREAGVALTPAGAAFPYGKDPEDRHIRLAPSFAAVDDLDEAMDAFVLCARLATLEALGSCQ